ncbi:MULTISPECIES: MoaD/ThiS family protein [Pseudomonas]|jgi:molybdopterin synthase sulfur carrier subunit|uniref:MoaD/ThiS family protein n=2 Tax=Pseudomonas chlororaphis TaxID=587753 RepID=A0AAP9VQ27_9PSED|nr:MULTISPECIES: MoaD/ThiS family protein [Pseudomonas]AUG41584.1 molybdopterin synthase sulfur carrier subunit [Pseudomonas chlororaphis]AZD86650.1 Molybdopterin synthase sulfur carrier subunit [Pseudomonas chlororaphis subsp. aureofaciens]AZD93195.1 Molybdopterin synthase sulfur carrier subunit [Pseudomonas chlororaphis subsp. aureofaciens]AZE17910.1 Molybdopterin synthase sulfur carrier subunit [Pseudomonas chlororaphis subsp. aureofaciens]AZE24095.1 Molybdopterin synthase sulfur carrier su
MKLQVQYFSRYRETLGCASEVVEGDFACLEHLRRHLASRCGIWRVLDEPSLMCARNQDLCGLDEALDDGDEVAFFPTVTGG